MLLAITIILQGCIIKKIAQGMKSTIHPISETDKFPVDSSR